MPINSIPRMAMAVTPRPAPRQNMSYPAPRQHISSGPRPTYVSSGSILHPTIHHAPYTASYPVASMSIPQMTGPSMNTPPQANNNNAIQIPTFIRYTKPSTTSDSTVMSTDSIFDESWTPPRLYLGSASGKDTWRVSHHALS